MAPAALIAGAALGLFVNGYWLSAALPPASRQLLLLTALAALAGAAVYWRLLLWAGPRLAALPGTTRLSLAFVSLAAGVLLFFAGTAQWLGGGRYISFLLPAHRLTVQADAAAAPGSVALAWFTTSVGDVSYGALDVQGWKRSGDKLVLQQPQANRIEWHGRTGESAQLMFQSAHASILQVSWDGRAEQVSANSGKFTYLHSLGVPWYASSAFVNLLGVFVFASLALAGCLALWEQRERLVAGLRASVSEQHVWARWETAFLLGAAVLALVLRLVDLGRAFPAVDEYFHLIAARQLVEGASAGTLYSRSFWIVTVPVSLAFRLFGYQLWAARLVGALVNVLGIWPLYLLGRKVSRPVAVLSVLLFVTSPWVVTFARITREYAYYPVFAYWIILGMVSFIPRIPEGFVLLRDWRALLAGRTLWIGLALLLPPAFAFFVDPSSTFRVMIIAYVVFAGFVLARLDWRHRLNLPVLALFVLAAVAAGYAAYVRDARRLVPVPRFNPVPALYFFPDPPQQWYFDRLVIVAALALLAVIVCAYLVRRANFIPLFMLCLFLTYLGFFTFLSRKFFHTRHLSTTEFWYILLFATGLYFGWRVLRLLRPWRTPLISMGAIALLAFGLANPWQVLRPVTATGPDNLISEDYLHDMSAVQAFLLGHAGPQDALISTVYGLYNSWVEAPRFAANYRITTQTPPDQVLSLIDQHGSGWIVIDQIRLDMSSFGPHAFAGNPEVEYIGLFGDQNVWHWRHKPGAVGQRLVAGKAQ